MSGKEVGEFFTTQALLLLQLSSIIKKWLFIFIILVK